MAIDIRPLGPVFGAEIRGVDLRQMPDAQTRAELLQAWAQHLVLLFRGQNLAPQNLLEFARSLGELDLAPPFDVENTALDGFPEIAVVSNIVEKGKPAGGLGSGELTWHSDMVYRPNPPVACALFAVEVPPSGGNTHFLSVAAARAQLPPRSNATLPASSCGTIAAIPVQARSGARTRPRSRRSPTRSSSTTRCPAGRCCSWAGGRTAGWSTRRRRTASA